MCYAGCLHINFNYLNIKFLTPDLGGQFIPSTYGQRYWYSHNETKIDLILDAQASTPKHFVLMRVIATKIEIIHLNFKNHFIRDYK